MTSFHVHLCHLSKKGPKLLQVALENLSCFTSSTNAAVADEYTTSVDSVRELLHTYMTIPVDFYEAETPPNTPGNKTPITIKVVNNRYLLYSPNSGTYSPFPFIVIVSLGKKNKPIIEVYRFECGDGNVCQNKRVDAMHRMLRNCHKSDLDVVRAIEPLLQTPRANLVPLSWLPQNAAAAADIVCAVVRIPRVDRSFAELQVSSMGVRCTRNALRGQGGLDSNIHHHVIIAQDAEHSLSVSIDSNLFRMCLYKSEDLFENHSRVGTVPQPLVTMSHCFHHMDQVVEEINQPLVSASSGVGIVTGMLATVQVLMRRNIAAARLRSMGSNRTTALYSGMHKHDITKVLQAMHLVTDNAIVAASLNGLHKCPDGRTVRHGVIVKHVNGTVFRRSQAITPNTLTTELVDEPANRDIRLHRCGAQTFAIAHQNGAITGFLTQNIGLDLAEISTALNSGIAFCHACAYDAWPTIKNKAGTRMNLINVSDFTEDMLAVVHKYVIDDTADESSWSRLRHNFRVTDGVGGVHEPIQIECNATAAGLLYFRRARDEFELNDPDPFEFSGAVYVPPSLKFQHSAVNSIDKYRNTLPVNMTTPTTAHALVPLVSQLATQTVSSSQVLIRNATDSLFHLNSICLHNRATKFGTLQIHAMLRKAWLHTNMIRAACLCDGIDNAEYYRIFAHLSNRAAQPLTRVDYWSSVPFV